MNREIASACTVSLLALGGCALGTDPSCDICVTEAVVYGNATDTSGAPVVGASIEVLLRTAGCGATEAAVFGNTGVTDAAGAYRLNVGTPVAPADHCVAVRATPPAGADLTVAVDTVPALRFRYTGKAPFITDSARVDLVLSPP